jgi:hypothetical protein
MYEPQNMKRQIRVFLITNCLLTCLAGFTQQHKPIAAKTHRWIESGVFSDFFPDTGLALEVAGHLKKKITDSVTAGELASIHGEFMTGFETADLTGIGYLTGIEIFSNSKNDVKEVPAEIGRLTNLVYLDLNKSYELRKIPEEIGNLKKIHMIRLSLTQVSALPSSIGNLTEMDTLWICCNMISSIPKGIGKLKKLRWLDIHSLHLPTIPDEICNLPNLEILDISYAGLQRLPDKIGNLKNLRTLNLFKNNLHTLPHSIVRLGKLEHLNVYDNFKLSEAYKQYLPLQLRQKSQQVKKDKE